MPQLTSLLYHAHCVGLESHFTKQFLWACCLLLQASLCTVFSAGEEQQKCLCTLSWLQNLPSTPLCRCHHLSMGILQPIKPMNQPIKPMNPPVTNDALWFWAHRKTYIASRHPIHLSHKAFEAFLGTVEDTSSLCSAKKKMFMKSQSNATLTEWVRKRVWKLSPASAKGCSLHHRRSVASTNGWNKWRGTDEYVWLLVWQWVDTDVQAMGGTPLTEMTLYSIKCREMLCECGKFPLEEYPINVSCSSPMGDFSPFAQWLFSPTRLQMPGVWHQWE
jgi:hypothetical protein